MTLAAAWTGGQYSVVRATACALLLPSVLASMFSSPDLWWFHLSLVVALAALAVDFGGRALAVVLASLVPFSLDGAADWTVQTLAGTWLFLHLLLPVAPYGSYSSRGRAAPAGAWTMPSWYPVAWQAIFVLTRVFIGTSAAMAGNVWTAGFYLLAGLLVVSGQTALAGWTLSLVVTAYDALGGDGTIAAALFFHLLTFQPAWLARREPGGDAIVFYDGSCTLCHGAVRFLLSEDPEPPRFRIAPLGGALFLERVDRSWRGAIPDSVVVLRDGVLLVRSTAVCEILDTLGGVWRALAAVLVLFPVSILDAGYDAVAARRYRWFGRKTDACPILPPGLRARVEA